MSAWPFGLLRVNIFVLPLLYVLGGIGAVALASVLRGPRRADGSWVTASWWRVIALGAAAVVLIAAGAAVGVATGKALAETSALQAQPTWFGATKAVADTRRMATPSDLVIIRADRSPPVWYVGPWLYYMKWYQGYPAPVAARPRIPARSTLPRRLRHARRRPPVPRRPPRQPGGLPARVRLFRWPFPRVGSPAISHHLAAVRLLPHPPDPASGHRAAHGPDPVRMRGARGAGRGLMTASR